ncbi:MAG TPA: DEAD/DEAH box helicase [Candidatus Limnocylindrales bacterium]|nr:DEAD/DEAH box helicase [Candidatus Limnocylindrales bacterium]
MSFDSLGLTPELLQAVAGEGYTEPTPVQAQAIPVVLDRRDLLAAAQTGTGKTAAFVLPILQILNATRPPARHPIGPRPKGATGLPIRALILAPTRELALQVEESVRVYGAQRPVRSTIIYGGVGYDAQIKAVQGGPEIVVATPGRLLDIAGQGKIDLRSVEILVLDEADRMLDMGFIRDIRRILALLPPRRQNLLFSATFPDEVRELAASFLNNPARIQIARRNAPIELVRQVVHPVDRSRKRELLSHLVRSGRIDRALVFTRTKHGANRLAEQLDDDGIDAVAIHGNKSQGQRVRALDDFKNGDVEILVATEIAARGLDIDGLPHVVNFELPTVPADYIHRIGRTGRAGLEGDAVSLVSAEEVDQLREIEALIGLDIPRRAVPGFEPQWGGRLAAGANRGFGEGRSSGVGRAAAEGLRPARGAGQVRQRVASGNNPRHRSRRAAPGGRPPVSSSFATRPTSAVPMPAPAISRSSHGNPATAPFPTMPGERFRRLTPEAR